MAKDMLCEIKKEYVEKMNEILAPMQDFAGIQYAYDYRASGEYVRIWDKVGGVAFLNVTGYSQEQILYDIAQVVLRITPKSLITDTRIKRKIVGLFE